MPSVVEGPERRNVIGQVIVRAVRVRLTTRGNELAMMVLLVGTGNFELSKDLVFPGLRHAAGVVYGIFCFFFSVFSPNLAVGCCNG